MVKRIISAVLASLGFAAPVAAEAPIPIGSATIAPPAGWREQKKEGERITLRSSDGQQQATISLMRFDKDASFEDFKKLCAHRISAEKKELSDGFVQPDAPFESGDKFGMYFSGADKKTSRLFSGYLTLRKRELITIYVEGVGVAPKEHLDSFERMVKALKVKV